MTQLSYLLQGFGTVLEPINLFFIAFGGFLGTVVGMLPGLGPSTAIAVLLPITFGMNPISAMILLTAIYYGAMFGGSRSSILLNTPGDAAAIAATFDGYPMAKKGEAGPALAISAIASLIGGTLAVVGFIFLAKPLANFALKFGPAEYFLLYLFALSAVVSLSTGNMLKGFISMCIGLALSTVGIDLQTSVYRFTFGIPELISGINFVVVVMGIYAVGEVLHNYLTVDKEKVSDKNDIGRVWITRSQWERSKWPIFRAAPLGFLIGVLPGAGASMSTILAYSLEKQVSKNSEEFGKGAIEGLASPESANNATAVGALIPMLTMGIPGSPATAVMLGALVMIGLRPGPFLFQNSPELIWSLIDSMFIGNIFLVFLNIMLVGILIKVLDTPSKILYPLILALAFVGTYTLQYNVVNFYLLVIFGVIGLFMKMIKFPIAPLILALIVGSDMEQYFRKSLVSSKGDLSVLFNSTISTTLLILTFLAIMYPFFVTWLNSKKNKAN
ncbi:MAG: transporter [Peptococcaceae bacterium BICA1-8]|nr:MAG: transporter [Peptococcaceae bacterium BICA1-8]